MSDKVNQGLFLPIIAIITGIIAPPLGMLLGVLGVCKAPATSLRAKLSICAIGVSALVCLALFAMLSFGQISIFDLRKKPSKPANPDTRLTSKGQVHEVASSASISTPEVQFLQEPANQDMEKLYTIQQLNQVIWVVAGVLSYNDVRFLEEADKVLSDSYIDVTRMNDPEVLHIVQAIRGVISEMRIEEGDCEIMEQEIAARRADALWNSLSGVSASGMNPVSCAINLITSSVQSYASYSQETKAIERDFKKQQWELDKARLKELDHFNSDLLVAEANLAKNIGLTDDSLRLSVKDASFLREQLKGGYTEDVLTYLTNDRTQAIYKNLPEYWYQRGARMLAAAEQCQNKERTQMLKEDARMCFEKYQKMFISFRRSREAVSVAGGMLKLLGEDYANGDKSVKDEMLKQAAIIEHFSDQNDLATWWQDNYVLYMTYKGVGEHEKARDTLRLTISALKNKSNTMTQQTLHKPIGSGKERPVRSFSKPIALCMQTLCNEYSETGKTPMPKYGDVINDFLNEQFAAAQTQLMLAGNITKEKQVEIIKAAIGTAPTDPNAEEVKCAIWEHHEDEHAIICQVPIKFFLTEDVDCEIEFWSHEKQKWIVLYEYNIADHKDRREYLRSKNGDVYAVKLKFFVWKKHDVNIKDINKIRLDIMHRRMPVGLVFSKEFRDPIAVRFGKKSEETSRHNEPYAYEEKLTPRIRYDAMKDRFDVVKYGKMSDKEKEERGKSE